MLTSIMDPKTVVEKLFELDNDIRWVGIVDQKGDVLQNVQRPGIETITDLSTDELTLRVFPTIMGLLWGRLIGEVGRLNCLVVSYSRIYLMAFYMEDYLVVLTIEPRGMPRVVAKLETAYGTLLPSLTSQDARNYEQVADSSL